VVGGTVVVVGATVVVTTTALSVSNGADGADSTVLDGADAATAPLCADAGAIAPPINDNANPPTNTPEAIFRLEIAAQRNRPRINATTAMTITAKPSTINNTYTRGPFTTGSWTTNREIPPCVTTRNRKATRSD
jgi:hypothetical protein